MPKLPKGNPRAMALKTLIRWEKGKPLLDEVLSEVLVKSVLPDPRDRALCGELVNGVVRHLYYIDYIISRFSEEPLEKMDPQVRNLLRLSVYQIVFMRIPERAAVAEAVKLLKRGRGKWIVGFVNAVLRRVAASRDSLPEPPKEMNYLSYLSVRYSYPEWMVKRWFERFGDEVEDLLKAGNEKPPLVVRTNTLKVTRSQLVTYLRAEIPEAEETRYSPEGIILRGFRGRVTSLKGFLAGWFQVQDEASQLVSLLVNPRPAEVVLDACAGVGGKTTHMAQLMQNRGKIYAYDLYDWRLERLKENAKRLGVTNVEVFCGDVLEGVKRNGILFHRVLIDAPCTGTGVIRRHPDIKWARRPEDLESVPKKQKALLEGLAEWVRPGGVLVYATCSLEPEENEAVVEDFLKKFPQFKVEVPKGLPEPVFELIDENGFLRTYPHRHDLDGFFAVRFRKSR